MSDLKFKQHVSIFQELPDGTCVKVPGKWQFVRKCFLKERLFFTDGVRYGVVRNVTTRGTRFVPLSMIQDASVQELIRFREFDEDRCELCGEPFYKNEEQAEMYHPDAIDGSVICHVQCGLSAGMWTA